MMRSRQVMDPRKTRRVGGLGPMPLAAAISAVLAASPAMAADKIEASGGLEEVVVTAQKKSENMQDVPVAIIALGTEKLDELNIKNLDDYVKYLPSVAFSRGDGQGGNGQPGSAHVYMRGVVSGVNENHSGSQPSVGTYLDEQPVTTIDGTVDVHVYDIARVEVLEGPQGTLYGASSQAGTIRIITNKPDPAKFEAGYDFSANKVSHGGVGYSAEGFINIPLSPIAAVRVVLWDEHTAGFIDNVAGSNAFAGIQNGNRYFPTWCAFNNPTVKPSNSACPVGAGSISNAAYVKDKYNTADTRGGRAALKLNLADNWTVTPTVMGQSVSSEGFFGYDPGIGTLQITHFSPESSIDSWIQTALTVEGKVANLDVTYAGAYMKRNTAAIADYADYSFFYDQSGFNNPTYTQYGNFWVGNHNLKTSQLGTPPCVNAKPIQPPGPVLNGAVNPNLCGEPIMPQQIVLQKGAFEKWSHEFRISTPQDRAVKATAGLFVERQLHNIYQQYAMPGYGFTGINNYYLPHQANGFADYLSIPTLNNTSWLTDEQRVDRDQALFAQVTWDITSAVSAQVGYRYFKVDNSLQGFYGYSANFQSWFGGPGVNGIIPDGETVAQNACAPGAPPDVPVKSVPCMNLNKRVTETGHVPRFNLTWKVAPDKMLYATVSQGFRPGGVNRNGSLGPYQADYLKNYEVGWKTQWLGHHLRWNGSVFWEDWNDFQFSFLGQYSLTIIANGGSARIKGIENDLEWAVGNGLTLSLNTQLLQARLQTNYCGVVGVTNCADPKAPAGTDMPVSPKFKGNLVARYTFGFGNDWEGNVQAAMVYQTQTAPALKTSEVANVGMQPAYGLVDLTAGVTRNGLSCDLFINNVANRIAEVSRFVTSAFSYEPYVIPMPPRTIGIRFGQKF
jgi:iron complex outermembrane receptor protein